jgi:hypothetical protein
MITFRQLQDRAAGSDLVLASLPGPAANGLVVVREGSRAESVAEQSGFEILPVQSVAQAAFLLDSGRAGFWLEDGAELALAELITGFTFVRQAPPASREERLRQAWRTARSAEQLKALYRAAGIGSLFPQS